MAAEQERGLVLADLQPQCRPGSLMTRSPWARSVDDPVGLWALRDDRSGPKAAEWRALGSRSLVSSRGFGTSRSRSGNSSVNGRGGRTH